MRRRLAGGWLLLLGVAWAGGVGVKAPAEVRAQPGAYATLLFAVSGQGTLRLRAVTPEGWPALALPPGLTLRGRTPVAVTVRVPELTPAGSAHTVTLELLKGDRVVDRATARVVVAAKAGLLLFAEGPPKARLGEPVAYRIRVVNRGNRTDRVVLRAEANTGELALVPGALELAPGQEGTAVLTLRIGEDRWVSPGYTQLTWVYARSGNADLSRKARIQTRWEAPGLEAAGAPDPTLRLGVTGSLGVGTELAGGRLAAPTFRYRAQPRLAGRLSDYVEFTAGTPAIAGASPGGWPEGPSGLDLGLKGAGWDAALAATPERLRLRSGFEAGGWRYRVGLGGRYDLAGGGLDLSAARTQGPANLQLSGATEAGTVERRDRLGVDYARPLGRAFRLRLGGELTGIQTSGYTLVGSARQGLVWENPDLNLLESLAATPQLGLYTLTLTGGSRRLHPLGLRASGHLERRPDGLGWKASGSLFAAPAPGTSLRVTAGARRSPNRPTELTFNPALSLRPPGWRGLRSSFRLGYQLRYRPQSGEGHQVVALGGELGYQGFNLHGSASYALAGPPGYGAALGLRWRPSVFTVLEANYRVELQKSYQEGFDLGWQQYWGGGVASELRLEHAAGDRLGLTLTQEHLAGGPLGLRLGYAVSDPDGLGRGQAELRHDLRLELDYRLSWRFPTPSAVVEAFGGRKVGFVEGRAFRDLNQNGVRDQGEPPVAGLTVILGNERTLTDAEGRYLLRVPPGTYRPRFRGLPATLDLYRASAVRVRIDERRTLDLPLAATAQLAVVLFHDANHNGVRDQGEGGVAYGGVRLTGPSRRRLGADGRGRVLATGLLPGRYRVEPDPARLPPGYVATTGPATIELAPGKNPRTVALGAALPPRVVRTTYDPGKLAVFAVLPSPVVAAGGELEVRAWVQGAPERVWMVHAGRSLPLRPRPGGGFVGYLRVPPTTPPGPIAVEVRAARGDARAGTQAVATVVKRALFELAPLTFRAGKKRTLTLKLGFGAGSVRLRIGQREVAFARLDRYRWRAEWTPAAAGAYPAALMADGEALGTVRLRVLPGPTGER